MYSELPYGLLQARHSPIKDSITIELAPSPTPSSSSSDSDAQSSAGSVASSQTSYSSQEQWPILVQPDPIEPVSKHFAQVLDIPRPHPRRTSIRDAPIPTLVRQNEKKGQFVYYLVDSATHLVEIIWPTSAPASHVGTPQGHQSMLPLRTFIEETLRRSKTSFSTLQVALFYLILLKDHVPAFDFTMEQPDDSPVTRALQCGRRMFLAALILASKYLQDRNYSARAWSKISGLQVSEINLNERAFLAAVNWKLHVPESVFNRWQECLVRFSHPQMVEGWRHFVRIMTPEMITLKKPAVTPSPQMFKPVDWRSHIQIPTSPADASLWESSPTTASPRYVEPRFTMQPPMAPMAPMPANLPTPSPMSSACPTPAASSACDMLRNGRRAMCSAMSMVTSRFCMDLPPSAMGFNGAPGQFSRRSSLASAGPSVSSAPSPSTTTAASPRSSPGSMVSDHSSRSSSVSSISQVQCSPLRNLALSRLATVNAAQKLVDLSAAAASLSTPLDDSVTILGSEPLSMGGLTSSPETIIIEDDSTPIGKAYDIRLPRHESRKRHRCSVDSSATPDALQDQVRMLMRQDLSGAPCIPLRGGSGSYKPAAKKACYMAEVQGREGFARPEGGPGMWRGILR